ncbi:MAG: pantoate--beta-alanine ligase, pantoate--beta-alanine ligase [Candidatus Dadabacteria bacterium CSP1-2]|nr:MAG: pantoate--beta-alanine ligase, pantoate--beta-alanine ligase [Candidatus Dadabacteria bacterium CSP1-2]OGE24734.1 MAG: pantoate--beta-alanine ligase [Candidatus Dadabacteria bacterium RBG_19FT_COMBO_40_33]
MRIISSIREMQGLVNGVIRTGKRISLVPTMGALHEGHINLINEGRNRGDVLVVSIFVNPTQFGLSEDFTKYPRDLEGDLSKIEDLGVDIVFAPNLEEIYPEGFQTYVEVKDLQEHLCGHFRPGHFRGVATVVLKLFNIVKPQVALFGEKDYQQLKIIQRMVKDLNLEVEVIGYPIVREKDGLALSSRNVYLLMNERNSASQVSKALREIKRKFDMGCRNTNLMVEFGKKILEETGINDIDYLEICDPETLESKELAGRGDLLAVAVRIKGTRLIDNIRL